LTDLLEGKHTAREDTGETRVVNLRLQSSHSPADVVEGVRDLGKRIVAAVLQNLAIAGIRDLDMSTELLERRDGRRCCRHRKRSASGDDFVPVHPLLVYPTRQDRQGK
jgi:hypothetical protein